MTATPSAITIMTADPTMTAATTSHYFCHWQLPDSHINLVHETLQLTNTYIKDECKHNDATAETSTISVAEVKGLFYIIFIGVAIAVICLAVQVTT